VALRGREREGSVPRAGVRACVRACVRARSFRRPYVGLVMRERTCSPRRAGGRRALDETLYRLSPRPRHCFVAAARLLTLLAPRKCQLRRGRNETARRTREAEFRVRFATCLLLPASKDRCNVHLSRPDPTRSGDDVS